MSTKWSVWCHGSVTRWCSSPSPCSYVSSSKTRSLSSPVSGTTGRSDPVEPPETGLNQTNHSSLPVSAHSDQHH
ncbi:hypothetical protein ILYODFUR_012453 [Ilyodon furcidens]|uniref:Uncharacterized protein n=1 Tax=Ilyodon furcidens TaxID=33524 RepID=A0ABV0T9R5_9TELE